MFNLSSMMQLLQNPQQVLSEQMAAQLIRENPKQWQQAQGMFANKNHEQQVAALRELYKSKGMNLDAVAKQYGVQL